MAAIDKLYVRSYYDYDNLRRWAIAYYPELLFYFYHITDNYQLWEDNCRNYVKSNLKIAKHDFERLGTFTDVLDAAAKRVAYYKEQGVEVSFDSSVEAVSYVIKQYQKTAEDWEEQYEHPIMCTPPSVDKKLKWICPVPCVRKYLHEQCGVNPKWEWFYKLFWKGKKHFLPKKGLLLEIFI